MSGPPHARRASASSAPRRSPSKKGVDAADADAFNPLVAMQTVIAGDMVPIKQRAKAAQQLATYFCELPTTPSLYAYYEAYLPVLASVIVAPIKAARDVQENALKMLKALGSHSARQFVDWCALHMSMAPTQDLWHVDWCGGVLLAAETRVPRLVVPTHDGFKGQEIEVWDERSIEFQELDAAAASVIHLWRAILDNSDDEATVNAIASTLKMLLNYQPAKGLQSWRGLIIMKLQPHFVDVADVLIGWAMSLSTTTGLRDLILELLDEMRDLWAGNSVFCLQLLESFSNDIKSIYSLPSLAREDFARLDAIVQCCILVARSIGGNANTNVFVFIEKLIGGGKIAPKTSFSCQTVVKLAQFLVDVGLSRIDRFTPLAMSAIRLLLNQAVTLVIYRRCDSNSILVVLEAACRIGKECLPAAALDPATLGEARNVLTDETSASNGTRLIFEHLLELKCFSAAKFTTQLCIQAVVLQGVEGLQVVAEIIARKMRSSDHSLSLWPTCFILACKDPHLSKPVSGHRAYSLIADALQSGLMSTTSAADELSSKSAITLLKLARVYASMLYKDHDSAHDVTLGSLLNLQIRTCLWLDDRRETLISPEDIWASISWCVKKFPTDIEFSSDIMRDILKKLSDANVSEDCVSRNVFASVITALATRSPVREMRLIIFRLALELIDSSSEDSDNDDILQALGHLGLISAANERELVESARAASTGWKDVWGPSNFTVGDFERVFDLLSQPETSTEKWRRVCKRINARLGRAQKSSGLNVDCMKSVTREAAKWIVQNRLRSPLGPPAALFSSVERILKLQTTYQRSARPSSTGVSFPPRTSAVMAVEFVIAMETLFGIVTDLRCPDTNADGETHKMQSFFRANVGVCEEWLSRIRPLLMDVASSLRQDEAVVHHGANTVASRIRKLDVHIIQSSRLSTPESRKLLRNLVVDVETSVLGYAEALCGLGDVDSITGLIKCWTNIRQRAVTLQIEADPMSAGEHWFECHATSWLQALRLEAEMKYEDAIAAYEAAISNALNGYVTGVEMHPLATIGLSYKTFAVCIRRCGRCYAGLMNWSALKELLSRVRQFVARAAAMDADKDMVNVLAEIYEKWAIDETVVASLARLENAEAPIDDLLNSHVFSSAATALSDWSTLTINDLVSVRGVLDPSGLLSLSEGDCLVDQLELLKFRPFQALAGGNSPTIEKDLHGAVLNLLLLDSQSAASVLKFKNICPEDVESSVLDPMRWSQVYFAVQHASVDTREHASKFLLSMARSARQLNNHNLAAHLLKELETSHCDRFAVSYENAALQMASKSVKDGIATLIDLCRSSIQANGVGSDASVDVQVLACLRMARSLATVNTGDDFVCLETAFSAFSSNVDQGIDNGVVGCRDELVNLCLKTATEIAPSNPRTWYEFSKWSHKQGKESLDRISANQGALELLSPEETQLQAIIDSLSEFGCTADKLDVRNVFCQVMDEGSLLSNRESRLRSFLANHSPSGAEGERLTDEIISLQQQVMERVVHPVVQAAAGYKSFIVAADTPENAVHTSRLSSRVTSVALRLLRMLTRFGSEPSVSGIIREVFTSGPLSPWSRIVPQLLSRVSHSHDAVSEPVSMLLVRLAHKFPRYVAYPAIVEIGRKKGANSLTPSYLDRVLAELQRVEPEMSATVELMVCELKRISILWDDAWIWSLYKMAGDVNRRISTLEKESQRVERNTSLTSAEKAQLAQRKAVAIMKPIFVSLDRLWGETLGRAVPDYVLTPHEKQFALRYGPSISSAIAAFREYCHPESSSPSSSTPQTVWQPFAELLKALLAAVGRRDRVDLAEISPVLLRLPHKRKHVVMPGSFSFNGQGEFLDVRVCEVSRSVNVLRTKTKPKSLKFVGSDGQTHRYLLKAREDLHLDERMMQFLGTVNEFLRADRQSNSRNLRARNYSVIPLSSDAGLIQMVPDVLPLFQIYTSRAEDLYSGDTSDAFATAATTVADPEQPNLPQQQPPTAAFYAKLKQYGIQDVSPSQRPRWPLSVLRRIHEDLVTSRPANVIQREIVLQSSDFTDVWTKMRQFSRSSAVMSVLGYIVGLGDRHLDNMLLCKDTGEVLHIDYNVCFDRGRKLKVPEVVPFRLTPIIMDALGLSGVDGLFQSAFVSVLRVVRDADSQDALLAMLDAFVSDPLADWTTDGKAHNTLRNTKQRMDVNVNLSLFLSRARERWQDTSEFVDLVNNAYEELSSLLARFDEDIGDNILRESQLVSEAVMTKRSAADLVEKLGQEWEALKILHPEENAERESLLSALEDDKIKLMAFAAECTNRHLQLQQMMTRVGSLARIDSTAPLTTPKEGALSLARSLISSIAMRVPPTHTTPLWTSILTTLEPRCTLVDQQVSVLVNQTVPFVHELLPVLKIYKQVFISGPNNVGDVYQNWADTSEIIAALISSGESALATKHIIAAISTCSDILSSKCAREEHELAVSSLASKIDSITEEISTTDSSVSCTSISSQFLDILSRLKLSNSQTLRVVKLLCARWLFSALDDLKTSHNPSNIPQLVHVAIALMDFASTSKSSMKKVLSEIVSQRWRDVGQGSPSVLRDMLCAVSEVTASLRSCASKRQMWSNAAAFEANSPARESPLAALKADIEEATKKLANDLQKLATCIAHVGEVNVFCSTASQLVVIPADSHGSDWQGVLVDCLNAVRPVVASLLRQVIAEEWSIEEALTGGIDRLDALVVDAMPAMTSDGGSPPPVFRECYATFEELWSTWGTQVVAEADLSDKQYQLMLLQKLADEHRQHIKYLEWVDPQSSSVNRQSVLELIGQHAHIFPAVFEGIRHIESSLLEVTQQLEYVASQISFSCIDGVSVVEGEIEGACASIQSVYGEISRFFDLVREVSEMALAVNAIETSTKPVCIGVSAAQDMQLELDQVGRGLLRDVQARMDRLETIQSGGSDAGAALQQHLQTARSSVAQANDKLKSATSAFEQHVTSLHPTTIIEQTRQLLRVTDGLRRLVDSIGLPLPSDNGATRSKASRRVADDPDSSTFVYAENQRLMKILQRSVESVSFMPEIHEVLVAHEQEHMQLVESASALTIALAAFSEAAVTAVAANDVGGCVRATASLFHALDRGSVITSSRETLKSCCEKFFEAARLADQLTRAEVEEVADNEEAGADEANDVEGLDGSEDETLQVPPQPIVGFQEQNRYGVEVVARIEEKLSGIVVETGAKEPLSVEDQSAWLIRAATNVDNLCVMYEGWTPWI